MNTQSNPRIQSPTRVNPLRLLHRTAGLAAVLPVLLLVLTGVPLQFTDGLQLGQRGVPFGWVHSSYGIEVPEQGLTDGEIVQVGGRVFVEERNLVMAGSLRGGVTAPQAYLISTDIQLALVPKAGDEPEEIGPLPGTITRFGMSSEGAIAIETVDQVLLSDDLGASWSPTSGTTAIAWRTPVLQPLAADLRQRYGASHVSWERWLQDLHSGRYFGAIGEWVMNLAGLALMLLAVSGCIVWWRARP